MTLYAAGEQFTSVAAVRATANCGCVTQATPSDEDLEELIDQASDVLTRLSMGRFYGRQTVTVYPCRDGCWDSCPCCGLDVIPLWDPDPVVNWVRIDGAALDSNTYSLHQSRDGYGLVKVGGTTRPTQWPSWQNLWQLGVGDNTFAINFTYGPHVDWVVEKAAIELVCWFSSQDQIKKNQLQQGTVSANYNNTTVTLEERLASARGVDKTSSVGLAMDQFFTTYGSGPRSAVWAPELTRGWTLHVFGS